MGHRTCMGYVPRCHGAPKLFDNLPLPRSPAGPSKGHYPLTSRWCVAAPFHRMWKAMLPPVALMDCLFNEALGKIVVEPPIVQIRRKQETSNPKESKNYFECKWNQM